MGSKSLEDGWRAFIDLCQTAPSTQVLKELFDLFFTHEERAVLTQRYWVIQALERGELTQREIAEVFKVSISQITRGSNALKIISPELKDFLKNNL